MLFQFWASVEDGGPTLQQHWMNVSCLPGNARAVHTSTLLVGLQLMSHSGVMRDVTELT